MIKKKLLLFFKSKSFKTAKHKEFVIVANNCWGAEIYKRYDKEYNTPFVGLFFYGPDYLKLLQHFEYYLSQPLQFVTTSQWSEPPTYPVGKLADIEIHFMHYKSENEAFEKWNRRLERMRLVKDLDNYYFKICDRDHATDDVIKQFHQLQYKNKVSFGIKDFEYADHVKVIENDNQGCVPDGLKLYHLTNKYIKLDKWLAHNKLIIK